MRVVGLATGLAALEEVGDTALMIAAQKGHTAMVSTLVAAGAEVDKARANDGGKWKYTTCCVPMKRKPTAAAV